MRLQAVTLVVPDYDQGIAFFVGKLGFELIEDTPRGEASAGFWLRRRAVRPGFCSRKARATFSARPSETRQADASASFWRRMISSAITPPSLSAA